MINIPVYINLQKNECVCILYCSIPINNLILPVSLYHGNTFILLIILFVYTVKYFIKSIWSSYNIRIIYS